MAICGEAVDPALRLGVTVLNLDEEKAVRDVFIQLNSAEFDVREQALNKLISKGPAILSIAAEFTKHSDPQVASDARTLSQRLLTQYDGYLPTDPKLAAALNKKVDFSFGEKDVIESIRNVAAKLDIKLIVDPSLASVSLPSLKFDGNFTALMNMLGPPLGFSGVARGDIFLLTTPQTAQKLSRQRHTLDWSELNLSRDEAERVGEKLQGFFPAITTEIHTGSEALLVRGNDVSIARAARLVALLKPGAADAIWPAPNANDCAPAALEALALRLSTPLNLALNSEEPLHVLTQLKKQKQDVFLVHEQDDGEKTLQAPPWPDSASGGSPLRLSLRDIPLGLILRWVERRAKFPAGEAAGFTMAYEIGSANRLQYRIQPKGELVLSSHVAGADVSFLYPRGAKPTAESDLAALTKVMQVLEPHRALFPAWRGPSEMTVLRGRFLMQGTPATLAYTQSLLRVWRESGTPPTPPAYKSILSDKLATRLTWDGRALSGGTVLRELRKAGNVNILLEEAADGTPPDFEFSAKDAQLLPPGQHTLQALLDDLTQKARAQWRAELGVIVLTPRTDEKK